MTDDAGTEPGAPRLIRREMIRRFATAVRNLAPVHHDVAEARALGHPDLLAPPTFAVVFTMPALEELARDPLLGLDWRRVLHRGQTFRPVRPLWAGDLVTVRSRVDAVRWLGRNRMFVTTAEVRAADGALASEVRTELVVPSERA